jgi:hypothetical protein
MDEDILKKRRKAFGISALIFAIVSLCLFDFNDVSSRSSLAACIGMVTNLTWCSVFFNWDKVMVKSR